MHTYLSSIPSAIIVNSMENLLRTVNIGRLVEEDIHGFSLVCFFKLFNRNLVWQYQCQNRLGNIVKLIVLIV